MASENQKAAARENVKKARQVWEAMSPQERSQRRAGLSGPLNAEQPAE